MAIRRNVTLALACCMLLSSCAMADERLTADMVTTVLTETDEAFANPMKGFRPSRYIQDTVFKQGEYVSVIKHYIKYTDLEDSPEDTAQKIIDWSNKAWVGIEDRNLKVIPRIVIVYPNGPDNGSDGYWPEGLSGEKPVHRWLTDAYKQRMRAFIAKLGEAWDNDPRVAAIEMGLWGQWGEHHIWPLTLPGGGDRIPPDLQMALGSAFHGAFKSKKFMVRNADRFPGLDTGFYWDSFALPDDDESGKAIIARKNWKTQMITGEVAYDWGDQTLLVGTASGVPAPYAGAPDRTLSSDENTNHVIDWIERTHASSLGWIAEYNQKRADVAPNAARMQKALGYRFVLRQATYPAAVQPGGVLSLTFDVSNLGNAPFYYQWPVEVSLLDSERNPVWSDFVHVDIRNWSPGYTYTVSDTFMLPADLPAGIYTLALAVLDPSGNLPSLRFANTNYYIGGRTPLGALGVGQEPSSMDIGPFDSLYSDHTLRYMLEGDHNPPIEDKQVYEEESEEEIVEVEVIRPIEVPGNLAFQKPVTVSSTESAYNNYAAKATDGDPTTRWSSEWNLDPSWIAVDLEDVYTICHVNILWEWSYAKHFKVQVSKDGEDWADVYETLDGKGGHGILEEIHFDPIEAQYVRIFLIKCALQWGYSIFEIEVFAAE